MDCPWPGNSPLFRRPHTLVFRVGQMRWVYFCHVNNVIRYCTLRTSSAPDFKVQNGQNIRRILMLGNVNGLYNPQKKLYVEFTGTNGDETDTSHFQDFNEEDVVWEMVYASDGVPVWSYPLTIPFDTREEEPLVPPLLHDDIKKGYYLPTWRERYQHRWKCLWGMTPEAPKEAPDPKKKDEQPIPVLELNEVATTCHLKPSTTRQPCS
ncbi:hypothetical protein TWF225_009419 [Orbilia oligospora]|uniref:Uncharacterized protein n=1 Tax=Orbilia oligospora TaxID=2813651 RepID=A0A8H2HV24_ORBOL|nr:hypothetical protein TWF225_009419 [Orbilia oligospora]KAF3259405.1 hypothetical protein TWF217_005103 [Orbilia oligospora]KAF3263887.1 hypothetical protein TWF128_001523 [Orbilia oligospora]KAF3290207.1 hypothetical protein TWF132_007206 [Orbilia oligospora]TGJ72288.1 hypothetical protein EYR41_004195 [Orbilia oligospora]